MYRRSVCQIVELLYSKCPISILMAANYTIIPCIVDNIGNSHALTLAHAFIERVEETTLINFGYALTVSVFEHLKTME